MGNNKILKFFPNKFNPMPLLKTNLFKLTKVPSLCGYRVELDPMPSKTMFTNLTTRILGEMIEGDYVYYKNMLILTAKMENKSQEIKIGEKTFQLSISQVPENRTQFLDIFLKYKKETDKNKIVLDYFRTIKFTEIYNAARLNVLEINGEFYLNVDKTFSFYYKSMRMSELFSLNRFLRDDILKKTRVRTTHLPKNISFKGRLATKKTSEIFFEHEGKQMNIIQYFKEKYNMSIRDTQPFERKKGGQFLYYPMEVLSTEKVLKDKDDEIKNLAMKPAEYFRSIGNVLPKVDSLKFFNYNNNFEELNSNVFAAPSIKYGNTVCDINRGGWDLRNKHCYHTGKLTINVYNLTNCDANRFAKTLEEAAANFNMDIKINQIMRINNRDEFIERIGDFNIIILPLYQNAKYYKDVKVISELYKNKLTQCIKEITVKKFNLQVAGNLLLKINSKIGGINHILNNNIKVMKLPTVVIGADIHHPSTNARYSSVGALVASYNFYCTSFVNYVSRNLKREDSFENFENNIQKILHKFSEKNGREAQQIVFIRDGHHREEEVEILKKFNKKLIYITSLKAHSIRFSEGDQNPTPGTYVNFNDHFYLVPHNSFKGTARPIKYTVIQNDSDLSVNEIAESMFEMSCLYSRATKIVSQAAPVYYAHLLAKRVALYGEDEQCEKVSGSDTLFYV